MNSLSPTSKQYHTCDKAKVDIVANMNQYELKWLNLASAWSSKLQIVIRDFHLSWKILLYLFCLLGLSTFLLESPIDIVLFIIIILWKKKYMPYYVSKNYLHHYIGHVEISLSPMLCSLRKILVIGLSQKPLTLHAWKFCCKKTIISWKHCFFVLRVRWPIKELLPLKL
jgi:hypothetical protein